MKPPRGCVGGGAGISTTMPDSAPATAVSSVGGGPVGAAAAAAAAAVAAKASASAPAVVKEGHVSKIASRFQLQFETNNGDTVYRKPEPLSLMTKPNRRVMVKGQ